MSKHNTETETPPPLVKALTAAIHAMKAYQYGNSDPTLAREVEKAADAALAEHARQSDTESPMPAHVLEFIDEELEARGWSRRDLAERMGGDPARDELALQIMEIRDPGVYLGHESAAAIARAFGTTPEIWINLDNTWRTEAKARIQKHAAQLYIALRMIFWSYEDDCGCDCDTETCCKKVKARCAKCEARTAINLIESPYAGSQTEQA